MVVSEFNKIVISKRIRTRSHTSIFFLQILAPEFTVPHIWYSMSLRQLHPPFFFNNIFHKPLIYNTNPSRTVLPDRLSLRALQTMCYLVVFPFQRCSCNSSWRQGISVENQQSTGTTLKTSTLIKSNTSCWLTLRSMQLNMHYR